MHHSHNAGLAREQGEVEGLRAELAAVQAEQGRLPALVAEVQEALDAEATAYAQQEAGERRLCCCPLLPCCWPCGPALELAAGACAACLHVS